MYNNSNYEARPSVDTRSQTNGLTDIEGAKAVARRLFDTYDRDRNGGIDNVEVVPMIVDVYKSFNRIFSPSRGDIDSFFKVLDRNGDGKVSQQDLEDLCIRYLTNQAPTQMRSESNQQIRLPQQEPIQQSRGVQEPIKQSTYQSSTRGSNYQQTTTQYDYSQGVSNRRPQM